MIMFACASTRAVCPASRTVVESAMRNDLDRTRTELVVEKIEYNIGLKEAAFSRRALEGPAK